MCVSHPAGWFAGVFREAEQQVENRPAMLQNTLSIKKKTPQKHTIPSAKNDHNLLGILQKNILNYYLFMYK